jgi:hypothetical protein
MNQGALDNGRTSPEEGEANRLRTSTVQSMVALPIRDPKAPDRIHCDGEFGSLQVVALDVRCWRQPPAADAGVLGKEQEDWLWDRLAQPWHGCTIVASGSTLRIGDETNGPGEKLLHHIDFDERMEAAMRKRGRTSFIGGDLHRNAFAAGDGCFDVVPSGVAQVTWKTKKRTNNWALLEYRPNGVSIDFEGWGA